MQWSEDLDGIGFVTSSADLGRQHSRIFRIRSMFCCDLKLDCRSIGCPEFFFVGLLMTLPEFPRLQFIMIRVHNALCGLNWEFWMPAAASALPHGFLGFLQEDTSSRLSSGLIFSHRSSYLKSSADYSVFWVIFSIHAHSNIAGKSSCCENCYIFFYF